ncbi:MAG: phosphatidate cytidylyltransferase [Anaerolineae bacterium]|nr:phosphatidate cytidylyltransferase [Anaerolineae bacterium]
MLSNNWIALVITFALALGWLRLNDFLAHRGVMSGPLSRKIIHMGTGPLFVVCWLLFDNAPSARWLAALVPLAITLQFGLVGLGVMKDQQAVDAMSRPGDRREILRGPVFYGIVFVVLTLIYWKTTPIGLVALMLLCGGDGLADIVGKRVKTAPLPWSKRKSVGGLLSVFAGGWVFSVIVVAIFISAGMFSGSLTSYLPGISVICLVGMLVESLPFSDIDNLTVPAAAVLLGHLFFG